ncbi:MAG TPA: single-stranded DNA-binding protein [Xanthobacteraceae bacterium]|nr:single-stranded DNA-binding protein [Xanthobacteraceae bacterium]
MAGSVNKVILIGNLGQDPEIRATNDGRKIATLSVACSERWKDKNTGEQKEHTEWIRVVVFAEGSAKFAEQYLRKGAKVYVEGKYVTRKWTDDKGVDRWSTEVQVSGFSHQLSSLERAKGDRAPNAPDDEAPSGAPATKGKAPIDDDIPF